MISCILLSAGESMRFGSPKALAKIESTTVIGKLQSMLVTTQVQETIIVLGANAHLIKSHILNHKKVRVVHNKNYKFGQTSSFQVGLAQVSREAKGVLLLPVDFPFIKASTVDSLIELGYQQEEKIVLPAFEGRKGHPPLFPIWLKEEILDLDNSLGVNTLVRKYANRIILVPASDNGVVESFNTPEEFDRIKKKE